MSTPMNVAACIVRAAGLPLVTLWRFFTEYAEVDREGADLGLMALTSGAAITCTVKDGRTFHLERQGLFVVGTVVPLAETSPEREACLDAIGARMAKRFVPGGTVDAWLAPLPTSRLAEIVATPCVGWPERLNAELGRARLAAAGDRRDDMAAADPAHVAHSPYATGAVLAWASVSLARHCLAAGRPTQAMHCLRRFFPLAAGLPPEIEAHFAADLDRLFAEAQAGMQALANEVA